MKTSAGMALLVCVFTVSAHAVDDHQPQPQKRAQEHSQPIPKKDNGDVPPASVVPEGKPRAVSREGVEYLAKLRKGTPFGTADFDLQGLRAGMGALQRLLARRIKCGDLAS